MPIYKCIRKVTYIVSLPRHGEGARRAGEVEPCLQPLSNSPLARGEGYIFMKTRPRKVNSLIQREVANFINREKYEGVSGLLTITAVSTSPDLGHAKVYFSVVGQNENEVLAILRSHLYEIQGVLNRKLQMKIVPRINFFPDTSGEYAEHIRKLLAEIKPDGE